MLLDAQAELGISNAELVFYIKVTHFYRIDYLKDDQLNMPVTNRTVRAIRKSLAEKGFLTYDVKRFRDRDGKVETVRIKYDWSGLIEALRKLPEKRRSHAENISAWYNEGHAENISAPSLYGKESSGKESSKQGAALKNKLIKRGMRKEVAKQLCEAYEAGWILKKIEAFDRRKDSIKMPGAWLRKAIEANDQEDEEAFSLEKIAEAGRKRYEAIREAVKEGKDVVIKEDYPVEEY